MLKKKVSTQPNQEVSQTVGYPNVDERLKKKRIICIYMLFRVTGMEEKKREPSGLNSSTLIIYKSAKEKNLEIRQETLALVHPVRKELSCDDGCRICGVP